MKPGRKSLANAKAFNGCGLEAVKHFALMGDLPPRAYGIVHCLDGLLSKYPDFSPATATNVFHYWIRRLQVIDVHAIRDTRLKRDVQRWLKKRPGTNFYDYHELQRVFMLILEPLVEARRNRDGDLIRSLAKLIEDSEPESATDYRETSWQKPVHSGLNVAAVAVENASQTRKPRRSDIHEALKAAGLTSKNPSSAKRYAKLLREAGVELDRKQGRRK